MMKFLNEPGIVKFLETLEVKTHIYIITELVKGGELFEHITSNEFLEGFIPKITQNIMLQ